MPIQSTEQQPAWSDHYIIALTGHRPKDVFVRNGSNQPYENPYDHTNSRWQALQQQLEQTVEQRLQEHPDRHFQLRTGMALGADLVWAQAMVNLKARHPDRITNIAFIPNDEQTEYWPGPDPYLRDPNGALRYDEQHRRLLDPSKKASNKYRYALLKSQIGHVFNSAQRNPEQANGNSFAIMHQRNLDMLFAGTPILPNHQSQGVDELFSFWDGLDGGSAQTTQLAVNHNQQLTQQLGSNAPQIKLTHFDPATLGFSVPNAGDVKSRNKTTGEVTYYATRRLAQFPTAVVEQNFPALTAKTPAAQTTRDDDWAVDIPW